MAERESIGGLVDRLSAEGYPAHFRAEVDGLRLVDGPTFSPEDVIVEKMARFEGISDPGDEAVVFAVRAPDGTRGTFTSTYGPEVPDHEEDVVRRLCLRCSEANVEVF